MEYISAKTIVAKTKAPSQWFGTDYNMNIYKGCCHGCIYCDSRSDCYQIDDFDKVRAKEDALRIIRNDLRRKVKRGVAVATKSTLMERDIDILQSIAEHSPVLCKITITTADDVLAKKIEPNVASSSGRFEMIRKLSAAGLYSGILLMPVLPFLEDSKENVGEIITRAEDAGAKFIYPAFGMTLRGNQRDWYYDKLERLFPGEGLAEKYRRQYGNYYECRSPKAKRLWEYFVQECEKRGIVYRMQDIIHGYKKKYEITQLSLFD